MASATAVTACGICGSTDLPVILDMGMQPLAEAMGSDDRYPLRLLRCGDCTLVQLSHVARQATVFPPDHPYATGNTRALREHFAELARDLTPLLSPGDLVADIGCNDGTLLAEFSGAFERIGVEPTDQGKKCADKGIPVWQDYFTSEVGRGIRHLHGPARIVTACNVLAHVPDPHDFLEGVAAMLDDDGMLVTENHELGSVTRGLQIDTVYHEHLRYYSVTSLARLLAMHGLEVASAVPVPVHGGSIRVTARRSSGGLQERAEAAAAGLHEMLAALHDDGNVIYGVGAATRATPLIHYAQIAGYLTCICETPASAKIGHLMPGTSIPVADESRLIEDQPGYALLLAWHIRDTLVPRLRSMGYQGKFILPLPEAVVLDD